MHVIDAFTNLVGPARRVTTQLTVQKPAPGALDSLSVREREIVALIARGESNKGIARQLDIAETTVKVHVQHIFRKLQLASRVQVALYAAAHGLA